ncbi:MAG: protoporphyrinogen oxidase [Gimesia sp.]|jgi:oxygen-dependent protoporphyrinogen oxidase|uniref:Coproporphyrinogen III oxidase n=1 Tax=Gimesia maris TaxID=122 RepID=A0A3D3RE08_9PLAN|nr:protoporphyrinogen oxidase [Gimesia sp.]HCO27079.1 protoporphyrinogen oxidase [Gimesia maris]|tara:strand:+ start:38517 stop:39977 length:1461 start_codon:yes stop_codon:yes gene_type:complete
MNQSSPAKRIAVVGGGITGLSAAFHLQELAQEKNQPVEVTLFESQPEAGGWIGTISQDGYRIDTGADMFITNKPAAIELCQRLGLEDQLISTNQQYRGALILKDGTPVPVPLGFELMTPSRILPMLKTPLLSPIGKLRMGLEYFLPRRTSESGLDADDESLAQFVTRRFGREALTRLIQPLVAGIYTSDPEKLSLRATLPRFLDMERDHRSLIKAIRKQKKQTKSAEATGARYGLFAAFKEGMQTLIRTLADRISSTGTILYEHRVTHVAAADSGYDLTIESAVETQTQHFDAVLLTTAAPQAGQMLEAYAPVLSGLLKQIEYASTAIQVSVHRQENIKHPLHAFGLVIPAAEQRKIFAVAFASRKFPGRAPEGCVQLRTFVGGAMQSELLEHSDDELNAIVNQELADILGVSGEPIFSKLLRHNQSMPQYHLGHLQLVERIEQSAATLAGLELAGNAYRGVGIPDCIHSAEQAAERLLVDLTARV